MAVVLALTAVTLLFGPRLARAAVRRRRWTSADSPAAVAEAAWRELRDTALDLRMSWDDGVTLRTAARRTATSFGKPGAEEQQGLVRGAPRGAAANPEASRALERLVRDVERARYARTSVGVTGRDRREVAADVALCSEALRAGATKKRRHVATWLPTSLLRNGFRRPFARPRHVPDVALEVGVDRAS